VLYVTDERKWVQFRLSKNDFKKDLTVIEVNILKAIETLDKGTGCFATNAYFAEYFNLHPVTVSKNINSLKDKGYINIYFERKNREKVKRTIRIAQHPQFSEKSQVLGVINYINGLYREDYDFEPIKPTLEIKAAIQKKIKEFQTQRALIEYLKMHRDNFLSTHGVSLWLRDKLDIT